MKHRGKHPLVAGQKASAPAAPKPRVASRTPAAQTDPANANRQFAALPATERSKPAQLRALELAAGNRAVNHLLAQRPIQAKALGDYAVQAKGDRSGIRHESDAAQRPNNTGLPNDLKSGIEGLSGMSLDSVKVHYNSTQPAQLNALAYAQGSDIHVAPGQEQHLPHEAWHVVQQAEGRVKPTIQLREGVPVNDDQGLEREANAMGAKALEVGGEVAQRAGEAGFEQTSPDSPQNRQSGENVLQGIFVYAHLYAAIHAANKDASYYSDLKFQRYLSADGHQVWARPRNADEVQALQVDMEVQRRQERIARAKLKEGEINTEEHEIRDPDTGLSFIKNNVVHEDRLIVQSKITGKSEPVFAVGNEFCITGDSIDNPKQVIEVTKDMVYAYWETPKQNEDDPGNQGSFSGYSREAGLGPDERYNCAAFAKGDEKAWIEPDAMHKILGSEDYEKLDGADDMEAGVDYVCSTRFHFWRAKLLNNGQVRISEKNGASPVYSRTLSWARWMERVDETLNLGIYRKK